MATQFMKNEKIKISRTFVLNIISTIDVWYVENEMRRKKRFQISDSKQTFKIIINSTVGFINNLRVDPTLLYGVKMFFFSFYLQ